MKYRTVSVYDLRGTVSQTSLAVCEIQTGLLSLMQDGGSVRLLLA